MCCGTGKQFKFSISAHTQWLDFRSSSTKWHISSLNIDDLIASKTAIQSFPPVQKLRAQNGHFLTRLKSSPERPKTKRKKRSWFTRKSMQQESCEYVPTSMQRQSGFWQYTGFGFLRLRKSYLITNIQQIASTGSVLQIITDQRKMSLMMRNVSKKIRLWPSFQ